MSEVKTVAADRMRLIIKNNEMVAAHAKKVLALIENDPSLDESFCVIFGIKPMPPIPAAPTA